MKKILKQLIFSSLLVSSTVLSSCGGFSAASEYDIEDIYSEQLDNGNIKIVIEFADSDVEKKEFIIQQGAPGIDGLDGNGIAKISSRQSSDGRNTIVTVEYNDGKTPADSFTIPNGVSIANIESKYDEETGDTKVTVYYTDGTKAEAFTIPRGEKGEPGTSIADMVSVTDPVTGITTVTVTFTDETPAKEFELPPGQRGNGIEAFDCGYKETTGEFFISIKFDDQDKPIEYLFDRPNRWYSDNYTPDNSVGFDGDMWYNLTLNIIFAKQNGKWVEVIDLSDKTEVYYEVTFDLNATKEQPAVYSGALSFDMLYGSYFYKSGYTIPEPTRAGYEFAGWYTSKNPGINNGAFTDLTPIYGDMELYAKWVVEA